MYWTWLASVFPPMGFLQTLLLPFLFNWIFWSHVSSFIFISCISNVTLWRISFVAAPLFKRLSKDTSEDLVTCATIRHTKIRQNITGTFFSCEKDLLGLSLDVTLWIKLQSLWQVAAKRKLHLKFLKHALTTKKWWKQKKKILIIIIVLALEKKTPSSSEITKSKTNIPTNNKKLNQYF